MIVVLPVSLWAQDTGAAMLRSSGGVLVNKNPAPASTALLPDDLIETPKDIAARIEVAGSTADMGPETITQFEGDELVLEHGTISVNTSRSMRVRVGCITVTPVNSEWTHYNVTDTNGRVTVWALKNDVYIDSASKNPQNAKRSAQAHSDRTIVKENDQKSRDEKCGAAPVKESSRFAARGAIMNSPWAVGGGAAGIGVLMCWALCRGDDPISPSRP